MAAGGPGDHPILDIVNYQIDFYGKEASGLIREMAKLMSQRELFEWWQSELRYDSPQEDVVLKTKTKLKWAVDRAKKSGWELSG